MANFTAATSAATGQNSIIGKIGNAKEENESGMVISRRDRGQSSRPGGASRSPHGSKSKLVKTEHASPMDVALPVDSLLNGGDNSLVAPTPQFQHESQLANVAAGSAASHRPPTQPTLVGAITDPVVIPDSALDVRALVSSHLQSEVEAFSASILANCSPGITKLVENTMVNTIVQVNAKVEAVDDKVDALDTKVAAMAAQNESNFKQVFAKLEALSIEHSPNAQSQNNGKSNSGKGWSSSPPSFSPPASSGGLSGDGAGIAFGNKSQGFFRVPDHTILFANTKAGVQVSSKEFLRSVLLLAKDCNLDKNDFRIIGEELDDRFEIQFAGLNPGLSANTFYDSLQLGRGLWKEQSVLGPDNVKIQFFISPDKNPAQVRKEVLSKKLQLYLEGLLPNEAVFCKKASGTVLTRKRKLVSVVIVDEFAVKLDWSVPLAAVLKLDHGAIEHHFKSVIAAAGGLQSS